MYILAESRERWCLAVTVYGLDQASAPPSTRHPCILHLPDLLLCPAAPRPFFQLLAYSLLPQGLCTWYSWPLWIVLSPTSSPVNPYSSSYLSCHITCVTAWPSFSVTAFGDTLYFSTYQFVIFYWWEYLIDGLSPALPRPCQQRQGLCKF